MTKRILAAVLLLCLFVSVVYAQSAATVFGWPTSKTSPTADLTAKSITLSDKVKAAFAEITGNIYASGTLVVPTIKTATGTAAAPAYSFSSDPNTGIYSAGVDSIGFSKGGAEAMRITNGGNVLIGTTTDDGANKLQVNGPVKFQTAAGTTVFGEVTLADDESIDVNTMLGGVAANCGILKVLLASNDGYGDFYLQGSVNDVTLISHRYAAKTDSDGSICVFSAGSSNYTLKNRLGASATFIFSYIGRK